MAACLRALLHPPLLVHLEDNDLFDLAPHGLEPAFLRLGLALSLLPTRRLAQLDSAAVDHGPKAFPLASSRRQLALTKQLQFAATQCDGCLAGVHADVVDFLDVQLQTTLQQFGAGHGIARQQRRLPGDVADQRWTFAFEEAEPAQFGIDTTAFAAAPSAAFADSERGTIQRADPQQQTTQEPQFQ
jgi:hypothetical protein